MRMERRERASSRTRE